MPRQQVATVPVYEMGPAGLKAPANTPSLQFAVKHGSSIEAHIEAYDAQVTVTGQVSNDGVTWAAMTNADHGNAFAGVVVNAGGHVNLAFRLRPGIDRYFRIINNGGRSTIQMKGSEHLDVQKL